MLLYFQPLLKALNFGLPNENKFNIHFMILLKKGYIVQIKAKRSRPFYVVTPALDISLMCDLH